MRFITVTAKVRILYAVSSPITARCILLPHLRFLVEHGGSEITVVCPEGEGLDRLSEIEGVSIVFVPIEREITPLKDLKALYHLLAVIRKVKPAIVNAGTAKAGLLGLLAARLLGVAHRVYVLHGLRLETTTGVKRQLLTMAERLSCRCSHVTLCISESVRRRAIELRLAAPERLRVLADGSWNGVDDSIFGPTERNVRLSDVLRESLRISRDTPIIGYVGRFTQDKGISELLIAYRMLRLSIPMLRLLLVGEFEKGDPLSRETVNAIGADPGVLVTGWVDDTAPYYQLMTVLALPSRREGFESSGVGGSCGRRPGRGDGGDWCGGCSSEGRDRHTCSGG